MRVSIFALLLCAGCTPSLTANEAGGIVKNYYDGTKGEAFQSANAHCAKFGKVARFTSEEVWGSSATFECVKP